MTDETITCPRCRGGSSKIEDPCSLCGGTGRAPSEKVYKNKGCGVLYFFVQDGFGFSDCMWAYKKDHPNARILCMTGSFGNGCYGAHIQGYVVIIEN